VLCVCTAEYFRRIEGKVPPEKGKGVYWEGSLLDDEIYDAKGNRRILPMLLDDEPETSIPRVLRGWTFCRPRSFELEDPGYKQMLRVLTGQMRAMKTALGQVPILPPEPLPSTAQPSRSSSAAPGARPAPGSIEKTANEVERQSNFGGGDDPASRAQKRKQGPSQTIRPTWVLVTGTACPESRTKAICEQLGQELAEKGYWLISGGWPGVEQEVARAFAIRHKKEGNPGTNRVKCFVDIQRYFLLFDGDPELKEIMALFWHETRDKAETDAIQNADVVVLLNGNAGTRGTGIKASEVRKPVIPFVVREERGHEVPSEVLQSLLQPPMGQKGGRLKREDFLPLLAAALDDRTKVMHVVALVAKAVARDLVYISYSHKDGHWHKRLRKLLDADPDLRDRVWDDTKIPASANFSREIEQHIARARVMVMLGSSHYFAPDSGAMEFEVGPAMEAHQKGELDILWFPVGAFDFDSSPVGHIVAATGAGAVPFDQLPPGERNKGLRRVLQEVRRCIGIAQPVEASKPRQSKAPSKAKTLGAGELPQPAGGEPKTATPKEAAAEEAERRFDVFLSHNSRDKPAVRQLAEALRKRGLRVWLDEWELVPGRPWQEALEEIIQKTESAAVLVGADGLGPWELPEMRGCLSEFVSRRSPVIPVLLPGVPNQPNLPLFLKQFTWVDMRGGLTKEGVDRLVWGITAGVKP
jgi:nucleotide-binding universal stress UspA family protein